MIYKWSVGAKDAKTRAARARENLRVLERFAEQQPDIVTTPGKDDSTRSMDHAILAIHLPLAVSE